MGTPYLSEVKIVSFPFAPKGWAMCNGQFMPINQNQALFSLLGTMYGGNGQTTFQLPDLRGRAPLHVGAGFTQGQTGGQEAHTLIMSEMPAHNHAVNASSTATGGNNAPTNRFLGGGNNVYNSVAPTTTMNPTTISNTGGSQPHANMQPYTVVNYVIALTGVFPSRN
jgi:microcystin-dependent protein